MVRGAIRHGLVVALCLPVAACSDLFQDRPEVENYIITKGTYKSTPVYISNLVIDGVTRNSPLPMEFGHLEFNDARDLFPRTTGNESYVKPSGLPDPVVVESTWTELFTGRAYTATLEVPLDGIRRRGPREDGSSAQIEIIYGPNGYLLIASDRVSDAGEITLRNVVEICAPLDPDAAISAERIAWALRIDAEWRSRERYPVIQPPPCPLAQISKEP